MVKATALSNTFHKKGNTTYKNLVQNGLIYRIVQQKSSRHIFVQARARSHALHHDDLESN